MHYKNWADGHKSTKSSSEVAVNGWLLRGLNINMIIWLQISSISAIEFWSISQHFGIIVMSVTLIRSMSVGGFPWKTMERSYFFPLRLVCSERSYFVGSTCLNPWNGNKAWYCEETCLEWQVSSFRDGATHTQDIRSAALSEGKEHFSLPVCPLHRWPPDRSDLHLGNIMLKHYTASYHITKVCFSCMLRTQIHASYTKYKLQSHRKILKRSIVQIFFLMSLSSRIPLPAPRQHCYWRLKLLATFFSMTLLHMVSSFICSICKHRGSYRVHFCLNFFLYWLCLPW